AKHSGASHKGVCTVLCGDCDGVDIDTTVDLQPHVGTDRSCVCGECRELRHGVWTERLTAKTGFHRHHQNLVEFVKDVVQKLGVCAWSQGHACTCANVT